MVIEYQTTMEMRHTNITPGARVAVIVFAAVFGVILLLNGVRPNSFGAPWRRSYINPYEEGLAAGRKDAMQEMARGALAYEGRNGLPEPLMKYFVEILFADYQIKYRHGRVSPPYDLPLPFHEYEPDPASLGYIRGFNEIMLPAIEKRFGKDVFNTAASKAEKCYDAKRSAKDDAK